MSTRAFQLIYDLRTSHWFLPSVMAILAMGLGALVVWLDVGPAAGLLEGIGWYQKAKPEGAHQVLSTIAGSMITVAGVVFSFPSSPSLTRPVNLAPDPDQLHERPRQSVHARHVHRNVRLLPRRPPDDQGGDEGAFVPQLAIMVGLLLALCSIAVLIFFIHHIPNSIHINNVVPRIGKQLIRAIADRHPVEDPSAGVPQEVQLREAPTPYASGGRSILAAANGYIEGVDDDALMSVASANRLVIQLRHEAGDYVFRCSPLLLAAPSARIDDETSRKLQQCFTISNNRSPTQDRFFLVDELVEIAARALSSGVNDPFTAMTCLDWLGAATAELGPAGKPPVRQER